jgi:HlyD family secretion protein
MNTSFSQRFRTYVSNHKFLSTFIALVIVVGGYFVVHAATATTPAPTYVLGTAQTGTVIETVTGSGQIATSESVDLNPQVSGTLASIDGTAGQAVTKGQTLFTIQATDAETAVETARENLASAQLDLRSTEDQNALAVNNDTKAVSDAYATLLSSGLQAQPSDTTTAKYQEPSISGNYTLGTEGTITVTTYDSEGGISFSTSGLVSATGLINTATAQPIGSSGLYILFPSAVKSDLTWTIAIPNTESASYISNENAYETAQQNQTEDNDPNGTNAVTLASKQLAITQAENSLASAEQTLAEYDITSPFTGTLATVPVNVGDQVSSGTTLGTVITNQEVATLSLNEVDVSKVQVGQKATLTFDAISGLSLAGTVATIDPVGTVSSGVVDYTVTISLDTQDSRVKSGMTVTAAIQTGVAQDVVTVPASAVKTTNGSSYVLTVPASDTASTASISSPASSAQTITSGATGVTLPTAPVETPVQIGLTDGTTTEITSGLTAGQQIVTKTITASTTATTTKTAATSATSLLGGTGTRAAGGGYGGGRGGAGGL